MQSGEHVSIERQIIKTTSQQAQKSIYERDMERFAQQYRQTIHPVKIELVSPTSPIRDYDFSQFKVHGAKLEPDPVIPTVAVKPEAEVLPWDFRKIKRQNHKSQPHKVKASHSYLKAQAKYQQKKRQFMQLEQHQCSECSSHTTAITRKHGTPLWIHKAGLTYCKPCWTRLSGIGKYKRTATTIEKLVMSRRGKLWTDEQKAKLRGRIPWNKGKVGMYSEETLKRMSIAKQGRAPWNKGRVGI